MKKNLVKTISFLLVIVSMVLSICSCTKKNYDANRLNCAIKDNDVEKVKKLLEKGIDPNVPDLPFYIIDNNINYPLSVACMKGNYEIVKLLIDYGASTIIKNPDAFSPMSMTVHSYESDTISILKLLLENEGDSYYCDRKNKLEGDAARQHYLSEATKMAPQKYNHPISKENESQYAFDYDEETANGIVEVVKLLIGRMDHFDVNEGSYTLLMSAASRGNIALAEYLLSIGADTTIETSEGHKTAYDYAIDNGHVELAELLKP